MNPFRPPLGTTCPSCHSEVKRVVPSRSRFEPHPMKILVALPRFDYLELEPCGHLMKGGTWQKHDDGMWTLTFEPLSVKARP